MQVTLEMQTALLLVVDFEVSVPLAVVFLLFPRFLWLFSVDQ